MATDKLRFYLVQLFQCATKLFLIITFISVSETNISKVRVKKKSTKQNNVNVSYGNKEHQTHHYCDFNVAELKSEATSDEFLLSSPSYLSRRGQYSP